MRTEHEGRRMTLVFAEALCLPHEQLLEEPVSLDSGHSISFAAAAQRLTKVASAPPPAASASATAPSPSASMPTGPGARDAL